MGNSTPKDNSALLHQPNYKNAIEQDQKSAIYLLDTKCRVVSWNRGAEVIKGYSANEVIGQPFFRFYPEKEQTTGKPMAILRQAVSKGSVAEEGWRVRKDGTEFWAHIVTTALLDEQRKVTGFLKIVHNYNEFKRLDNQRQSLLDTVQLQKKIISKQKTTIKDLEKQLQN